MKIKNAKDSEATKTLQMVRFEGGHWRTVEGAIAHEALVRIHVNGTELVTLSCTPIELDLLALGFLRGEGVIQVPEDVRLVDVCPSGTCVDVWLWQAEFKQPEHRVITSGCGGGVTFADLSAAVQPVQSALQVTPAQLHELLQTMQDRGSVYRQARGVHTAGLATADAVVAIAEDIGRHNTIDKLWGRCLVERIPTQDRILLTTGRVSSEMLHKAAQMGVPIIASRTSPTSLSVALATAWNITLVGYIRRDSLIVYAGQERITNNEEEQ